MKVKQFVLAFNDLLAAQTAMQDLSNQTLPQRVALAVVKNMMALDQWAKTARTVTQGLSGADLDKALAAIGAETVPIELALLPQDLFVRLATFRPHTLYVVEALSLFEPAEDVPTAGA